MEVIAKAWLRHQGYTDERIDAIVTGHNTGCELEGYSWNCRDEEGKSLHPDWDALVDACAIANVAVEALGGLTRAEQWTPVTEDGDRWVARTREQAERDLLSETRENLDAHGLTDFPAVVAIEGETRWVSGWTVTE